MSADRQCGLSSLLPMSCQERTQAFARNLNSILRKMGTPGSAGDTDEDENTWLAVNSQNGVHNGVTNQQPTHDSDSFYDFDIENESPGSPVDGLTESEIARLVAVNGSTTANGDERHYPAQESSDLESGYVCASPVIAGNTPDSDSSEGQYYDPASSDSEFKSCLISDNDDTHKKNTANLLRNGFHTSPSLDIGINTKSSKLIKSSSYSTQADIENSSDSLPPSQTSDDVTPLSQSSTTIPSLTPNSVESHSSWTLEDDDSSTNLPEDCSVEVIPNSQHRKEPEINGKHTTETLETENYELDTKENTITHNDVITDNLLEGKVILTNGFNHCNDLCNGFEMKCDLNIIRNGDVPVIEQREATPDETAAPITQMTIDEPDTVHLTVQYASESVSIENYENNETEEQPRIRRCSSLKCGKTPPGTPGNPSNKKIVRFADALGLDLADIRTFLDDIPKIPKSAYEDLQNADLSDGNTATCSLFLRQKPDKCLLPMFQQPGGLPNFFDKVRERQVCLENAVVQDPVMLSIIGSVRVRNLDFHKSVYIRYTLDSWKTYADLQASYVMNSCDGFSDKFTFILFVHTMTIGQRLEFAVRFHCKGFQYWDNNMGANYCFQCLPSTTPSYSPITCRSEPGGNWNASFY